PPLRPPLGNVAGELGTDLLPHRDRRGRRAAGRAPGRIGPLSVIRGRARGPSESQGRGEPRPYADFSASTRTTNRFQCHDAPPRSNPGDRRPSPTLPPAEISALRTRNERRLGSAQPPDSRSSTSAARDRKASCRERGQISVDAEPNSKRDKRR